MNLPQLTKNNHFQFELVPEGESYSFYCKIDPPTQPPLSPLLQAGEDARYIYESAQDKKIKLCLSGGIDSECMAHAFLNAKIPFEAVFLKFKDRLNHFDITTNIDFCESKGIKYSFVDLDVIQFLESGQYLDVATKYECQSPQIASHLWLLDQVDGFPCLGGNPIAPIWQNEKWFFIGLPGDLHSTYFKYFLINNREGVPWFFIYSPELMKSFFSLDCMKPYLNKQVNSLSAYSYAEKCKAYVEGGFQVVPRGDKYTGFELVKKYYDEKYNSQYGDAFNQMFRKPLEEMFPFPDKYFQLIPNEFMNER